MTSQSRQTVNGRESHVSHKQESLLAKASSNLHDRQAQNCGHANPVVPYYVFIVFSTVTILPCRWRQQVPPKRLYQSSQRHIPEESSPHLYVNKMAEVHCVVMTADAMCDIYIRESQSVVVVVVVSCQTVSSDH
jgi:hypothetical protein